MDSTAANGVYFAVGNGIFFTPTAFKGRLCVDAFVDTTENVGSGSVMDY